MKKIVVTIFAVFALGLGSQAEEMRVEMAMQWIETSNELADALQKRLKAGGSSANQAVSKLPGLIASGKLKQLKRFNITMKPGERKKGGAQSFDESGKLVPGLAFFDLEVHAGPGNRVSVNYTLERSETGEGGVHWQSAVGSAVLEADVVTMLERLERPAQPGKVTLVLMRARPSSPLPKEDAAKVEPALVTLEAELLLLGSARQAKEAVDKVAADSSAAEGVFHEGKSITNVTVNCRNRQPVKSVAEYAKAGEEELRGGKFKAMASAGWGLADVSGAMVFAAAEGGYSPMEFDFSAEAKLGEWILTQGLSKVGRVKQRYVLAVRATATGGVTRETLEEPLVLPELGAGEEMTTVTYNVRPGILRRIQERYRRARSTKKGDIAQPTAVELLRSAKVIVKEGSSAIFDPDSGTIVAKLTPKEHAKFVEVVNSLVE